jgi:DNA-binding transcriptional regulator LsrR (DeoR family)
MGISKINDDHFLFTIAREHYIDEISQTDLASKYAVSKTHIGRLLEAAKRKNIVRIILQPPVFRDLESRLIERYPALRRVIIVPSVPDYSLQVKLWASESAAIFRDLAKPGRRIGLSGGMTVFEMAMAVNEELRPDVQFYATAILGRSSESAAHISPTTTVTVLWARSGRFTGTSHFVTISPYLATSRSEAQSELKALSRKPFIREYLRGLTSLDAAFFSLGLVDFPGNVDEKYKFTMTRLLKPYRLEPSTLDSEGAVGDLNYSFFDSNGKTRREWKFFLGIDVDFFAEMAARRDKSVIAIAGTQKEVPLRAALLRGLFNIWVTDQDTARLFAG